MLKVFVHIVLLFLGGIESADNDWSAADGVAFVADGVDAAAIASLLSEEDDASMRRSCPVVSVVDEIDFFRIGRGALDCLCECYYRGCTNNCAQTHRPR